MSKGLEKLKLIQKVFEKLAEWSCCDLSELNEGFETNFDFDFATIEKELKALEIIKNKGVNVGLLNKCNDIEEYIWKINTQVNIGLSHELTEEEYDLLKEVLL